MKILNIVGARPNFMKIAPLMAEYARRSGIEPLLVHTGQHYDEKMSDLFFRDLGIPKPDVNLEVGSGSHAVQTAEIMKAFEPVVLRYRPDAVLVDLVAANRDFSLAFWYKTDSDPGADARFFFRRAQSASDPSLRGYVRNNRIYWSVGWEGGGSVALYSGAGMLNGQWHHVVCRRRDETLSLWIDGTAHDTRTDPNYARNLFYSGWSAAAIGLTYTSPGSDWPFAMGDFRAYDRALRDWEIQELSQ